MDVIKDTLGCDSVTVTMPSDYPDAALVTAIWEAENMRYWMMYPADSVDIHSFLTEAALWRGRREL